MSLARRLSGLLFLGALLIAGCAGADPGAESNGLSGRIMLWHSLATPQAAALDDVVRRFLRIHPELDVIMRGYPSEAALVDEFMRAANVYLKQ